MSLFEHTSGSIATPTESTDPKTRSQWTARDASAALAVCNNIPPDQRTHFRQLKTARALYDAVVKRYSSPSSATIGRLELQFLFPELAEFTTVADLITHLCSLDTRYCAALDANFLAENKPPMYLTLNFLTTRLLDTLRAIRDHFLSLEPTKVTIDSFEKRLLEAGSAAIAVAASRGTPLPSVFEGCFPSLLVSFVASAVAVDFLSAEEVGAARGSLGGPARCGYIRRTGQPGAACTRTDHTESCCFFHLDDLYRAEHGEQLKTPDWLALLKKDINVFAYDWDVIHAGMYAIYAASTSVEGDCYSCVSRGARVEAASLGAFDSASTDSPLAPPSWPSLLTTPSWHALPSLCLWASQVPAPAPEVACTAVPSLRRGAKARRSSFLLVSSDHSSSADPPHGRAEVRSVLIRWIRAVLCQLSARFQQDLPVLRLHSGRGGEFSSGLLEEFCGAEGIRQMFTLPASPQQDGIAERRIGLVMEVARTSIIHAAAPRFLWPFAVRYAAEQLNPWPHVSHLQTSPTLQWTGEVGDAPTPLPGPAPLGVSQVDPSPLVEPVDVSSDTSGPAEGGDPTHTATVTPRRSARLAVPTGFPPRPSSPLLQPFTVDSGAAGGGTTEGAGSGGAACPLGTGGAGAGSPGTSRQEALSLERLCEWAVQWGSPGGGASRLRAGGAGTTGSRGSATGGTGGASAGGTGACRQETLLPERLRKWAICWGSPGGGAGRAGATGFGGASPGGASASVPGVSRAGGTGTGGTGATGSTGGAGPVRASAVVLGVGCTGGADIGGATGCTGVGGSRRQESLSPQQLRKWAVHWGSPGVGAGGAGSGGAVPTGDRNFGGVTIHPQLSALRHLLSLLPATTEFPVAGTTPPLLFPPTVQEPASRPVTPVRSRRAMRPCPPPVPGTHIMALRPSSVPQHVVLSSPPVSSLPHVPDPESDLVRAASPTVTRLLATVVTDPSLESSDASALVAELIDFFELECLAAAAPHLASTLICPKGDLDALDILTPRTYVEGIMGPYSSQWQMAMDAETASWKSTGTYVNEVPPPGANIVDGMWIFRVKRPMGSPSAFKARYVARGNTQQQRTYELQSLDFSTAFLQGSLHEAIYFAPSTADPSLFLRTDTSLPPFYVLVYIDDLVFATADMEALALVKAELQERHTCTDLGPSALRLHVVLSTAHSSVYRPIALSFTFGRVRRAKWSIPELVGCLMYMMTCTRPDLVYPLSLLARYVAPGRHQKVHWEAAKRVLCYLCSTLGMGLVLGGRGSVVLTGHSSASWADDQTTHWWTQGYIFSLVIGSVSWRSTRSSSVISSSCEAEIYAGAMAAHELHWLTYLLTDLGEWPRSPPLLYVDNKAMIALCQDHRLEHRTKHIALCYFLMRELEQRV
ncbi:unnamed protein product [Closterium sp. NIES-53]